MAQKKKTLQKPLFAKKDKPLDDLVREAKEELKRAQKDFAEILGFEKKLKTEKSIVKLDNLIRAIDKSSYADHTLDTDLGFLAQEARFRLNEILVEFDENDAPQGVQQS